MKVNKLILITFLFLVIFTVFQVFLVNSVLAQSPNEDIRYAEPPAYQLEVPLGNTTSVTGFNEYIKIVYRFAVGLIALISLFLIVLGGIIWIIAAGNEQSITKAKTMIMSAIIGLLLALSSYVILYTINPKLVSLEAMQIPYIELYFGESGAYSSLLEPCSGSDWGDECQQTPCGSICMKSGEYCRGIICEDSTTPVCAVDSQDPLNGQKCYSEIGGVYNECYDYTFGAVSRSPLLADEQKYYAAFGAYYTDCICSLAYNDAAMVDHLKDLMSVSGYNDLVGHPADPFSFFSSSIMPGACLVPSGNLCDTSASIEGYLDSCGMVYYDNATECAPNDQSCQQIYDARVAAADNSCQTACQNDSYGIGACSWHTDSFFYAPDGYTVGYCASSSYQVDSNISQFYGVLPY
ncbi:MAG: pilin [Patescibacteria group bacterium]